MKPELVLILSEPALKTKPKLKPVSVQQIHPSYRSSECACVIMDNNLVPAQTITVSVLIYKTPRNFGRPYFVSNTVKTLQKLNKSPLDTDVFNPFPHNDTF